MKNSYASSKKDTGMSRDGSVGISIFIEKGYYVLNRRLFIGGEIAQATRAPDYYIYLVNQIRERLYGN